MARHILLAINLYLILVLLQGKIKSDSSHCLYFCDSINTPSLKTSGRLVENNKIMSKLDILHSIVLNITKVLSTYH